MGAGNILHSIAGECGRTTFLRDFSAIDGPMIANLPDAGLQGVTEGRVEGECELSEGCARGECGECCGNVWAGAGPAPGALRAE